MVDFVKKVMKHRSDALHPGEEIVAATIAQPPGSTKRAIAFGIGGAVGAAVAAAGAGKKAGESGDTALAAAIPPGKNVMLAVTPLRFLVFEHKAVSGNPGDLLAEFPVREVTLEAEKRKMTHLVTVGFRDGSTAHLEIGVAAKPDRFLAGFATARG